MGDDFRIFFVKPDKNEENNSTLVEAFETLLKADYSFKPEWISPEECLSMDGKGKQIYILDPFEGAAFEHLKKMGYRIYGPRCILANLLHGMELPKNKKRPIYNLSMKGVKICCTSIDRPTRDDIMSKVHLMGGEMDSNLTADVTHLIAGEVGSNKYLVAADKGKHVMLKDWVSKVWEFSQDMHILATDDIFEKYVCPPFLGLTVVVSGFSNHERNQMRGFVIRGGGKYSGELKMNECTHLVVKEPKGAKYEAAKNWRIRIVRDRWLFECMDKSRYLDPKPYQFGGTDTPGDVKTSTPERRSTIAPHISDISAIANGGSNSSMQRVDETTDLTSTRFSEQFSVAGKNLQLAETRISTTSGDPDATITPADIFLDDCRIYFSGIKASVAEKLKKIVSAGGGLRAMEIKENTTHVIIGEVVTSDLLLLNNLQECPQVVTADWLMDCFHQNVHLSEEKYLRNDLGLKMIAKCDKTRRKTEENPQVTLQVQDLDKSEEKRDESETKSKERKEDKAQDSDAFRMDAPSDLEMADLLSQYIANAEGAQSTKSDTVQGEAKSDEGNTTVKPPEAEEDGEAMTQDPNDMTADEEVSRGIFHKKTFVILGFDEDETTQLNKFVESKGGHMTSNLKRRHVADIAIVPLMGFPVDCTVSEILTNAWLQMCIEGDELLPYDEHWLSRPIELPDSEPLTGCCISVSGYVGVERECLMHLAEALGATVQDHFARRSNKNVQASTHLIVNHPSGPKYTAAKKWKLPAVGKEWIFACINGREQAPVEEYLIEHLEEKRAEAEQDCADNTKDSSSNIENTKAKNLSTSSLPTPPPVNHKNDKAEAVRSRGMVMSEGGSNCDLEGRASVHSDSRTPGGEASRSKGKPQEIEDAIPTSSAESSESGKNTAVDNPMTDIQHRLSAVTTPSGIPMNTDSTRKSACKPNQSENITAGSMKTPVGVMRQKWGKSTPASASSTSTPLGLIRGGGETPGTFLHPDFRPKFNEVFNTPDNAVDLNKSTPLGEIFKRQITKAAQNSAGCEDNEMLASQSQSGELAPLHGVVIAVAKKLGRSHEQYNGIVVELGGDYSWHNGQHVTHFVFQGRLNDTNKEFRKARDEKKIVVSPYWLYACKEQNCRVDESLYPHNYNPSYTLTVTPGQKATPSRSSRALARNKIQNELDSQAASGKTPRRKMPVLNMEEVLNKVQTPSTPKAANTAKDSPSKSNTNMQESPQNRQHTDIGTEDQGNITVEAPAEKETSVDGISSVDSRNNTNEGSSEKSKNQEMKEALTKTLGTVLAEASRSRRSNRRKGKRINLSGQLNASAGNTPENHLAVVGASSWANKNPKPDILQPEPSQSLQVTWDDPTERLEKEKLAHRLERVCEPSQNTDDLLAAMEMPEDIPNGSSSSHASELRNSSRLGVPLNDRSPTPEPPPLVFPVAASHVLSPQPVELLSEESSDSRAGTNTKAVPVVLISGMQNNERVDYSALVEHLGGKMVEKQHFDPSSTHLVVGQPARNEKYLSCVASGKWVLHKSYFEACRKEDKFVKEEPHEWGSAFTIPLMQNMTAQANKLAAAAHKWRKKIASIRKVNPSCQGAFDEWTVLLCLDKSKEENFQRLLQAGGAKVSTIRQPFPTDIDATHAFIDLNKMKIPQEDLEKLIRADVHCLKTEFIPAYLTDEPSPDPSEFYPAEVVALKACMPEPNQRRKRRLASDDSNTSSKTRKR